MRSQYFLTALLISVTQALPQLQGNALKPQDDIPADDSGFNLEAADNFDLDSTAGQLISPIGATDDGELSSPPYNVGGVTSSANKEEKSPNATNLKPSDSDKSPSNPSTPDTKPLPGAEKFQSHKATPFAVCAGTACQVCRSKTECRDGKQEWDGTNGMWWLCPIKKNNNDWGFGCVPLHEEDLGNEGAG